jgi:predicted SAM-dependent methyltransferase
MKLKTRIALAVFPPSVWETLRQEWPMTKLRWKNTLLRRRIERRFQNSRQLKIHLGCGKRVMAGWVNVDCFRGPGIDLTGDLRCPLPFADGSARLIYSEHVLEHLQMEDALRLLQECQRVLAPDGILRIGVPDAGIYLRAYISGDQAFFDMLQHLGGAVKPLRTPIEVINHMFRMGGQHLFAWDWQTLNLALTEAGFVSTRKCAPGVASSTEICLDDPCRAFETLYMEASKMPSAIEWFHKADTARSVRTAGPEPSPLANEPPNHVNTPTGEVQLVGQDKQG